MLAYDYPILGLFWTMLIIFLWIAWLMLLFKVIFDIFRSHDMGGVAKAFWAIFVIIIPWLGVLVYLIARGRSMQERDISAMKAEQEAMNTYIRQTAGTSTSSADELAKLSDLKAQGVLTDAEFAAAEGQAARLITTRQRPRRTGPRTGGGAVARSGCSAGGCRRSASPAAWPWRPRTRRRRGCRPCAGRRAS